MCKMKSALYIVAILSFALVSCVQRLPNSEMPNVENGAITMVKATVNPLQLEGVEGVGNYSWSESTSLGIYGTAGVNERYAVVKSTTGDNEAYFYGNAVDGELTIYMPHSIEGGANALEGRVKVVAEQNYYATALEHLMFNASFLAKTTTSEVVFDYYSGLLKVLVHYDVKSIASISLRAANITIDSGNIYNDYLAGYLPVADLEGGVVEEGAASEIRVVNFPDGLSASEAAPATVWVALAPGVYENLVVDIVGKDGEKYQSPVKGPFEIKSRALSEKDCVAIRVDYNNGADDFVGENGDFNESK